MTFSPLISGTVPHHNKFSSRAGRPVTRLIQHHWAGTGGGIERMTDPNQQASCTYIITTDGRILGHVPEEYRPWTSGSAEADAPSITIEVQNTGGQVNGNDSDPNSWPISDAAYGAIIRLLVDVAQRHGWTAIDSTTYVGHRQFYSTACPGGYLWARMEQTRQLAQQVFTGGTINVQSISTSEEDDVANTDMSLQENTQQVLKNNKVVKGELSVAEALGQILDHVRGIPGQVLFENRFDCRNIVDSQRQSLFNDATILAAIGSIKPGSISAEALAEAIPADLAEQVADLLAKRLAS